MLSYCIFVWQCWIVCCKLQSCIIMQSTSYCVMKNKTKTCISDFSLKLFCTCRKPRFYLYCATRRQGWWSQNVCYRELLGTTYLMSMKNSWTENLNNYLNCMHHHEKWRCPVSPTLYFYHPWVRDYSWWWHHYLNYHFQVGWVVTCSHTGKHTLDCQNDVDLKRKEKHTWVLL